MNPVIINITGDIYLPIVKDWSLDHSLNKIISEGDINITNLEAPIRDKESNPFKKSGPALCQDEGIVSWLEENNFNVINCANNHIFDYGEVSVKKTLDSFSSRTHIVGIGYFDEAYCIKIIECKNVRIGILAMTQYEFGVHDDFIYTSHKKAAAWMCHPKVSQLISNAHDECDFLIVLPHAGLENFYLPLPELRTLYRNFIDLGADAVVASHPHIAQPWEEYQDKYICYSLGNFCFDFENNHSHSNYGLVARFVVDSDKNISFKLEPTYYNRKNKTVCVCENKEYESFLDQMNEDFRDEHVYLQRVNQHCLCLKPTYDMVLSMGGYHQISTIRRAVSLLKLQLFAKFRRKSISYNDAHFINNLRCETHRWVLSRIYELQNRIDETNVKENMS